MGGITGDLGMHTHGFMTGKYKLSSLDATYLRSAGIYKSAGERADPSWGGDRNNFSIQDVGRRKQLFLATPDGLKRRYQDGGVWKVESLQRPSE